MHMNYRFGYVFVDVHSYAMNHINVYLCMSALLLHLSTRSAPTAGAGVGLQPTALHLRLLTATAALLLCDQRSLACQSCSIVHNLLLLLHLLLLLYLLLNLLLISNSSDDPPLTILNPPFTRLSASCMFMCWHVCNCMLVCAKMWLL